MSGAGDAQELARLRAEHAQLAEQVKLLVRTEQRLYRSQNELDVQLLRLRALARFSLDSTVDESADDVLLRALRLLSEGFAVDCVAAVRLFPGDRRLALVGDHLGLCGGVPVGIDEATWDWLVGLAEPVFVDEAMGPAGAPARHLAEAVFADPVRGVWSGGWMLAVVPLRHAGASRRGAIVLASWRARPVPVRDGGVAEQHLPFLQLLGHHVEHAIRTSLLTEHLRERSDELGKLVEKLERAQQALVEAQKMEAIGRLAGGVAHDFNNLLTVILGCGEDLLTGLPPGSALLPHAQSILEAGQRAAKITQQLLALGRRQFRRPAAIDLSRATVASMEVLRRMLGSRIEVVLEMDGALPAIEADPAQFEQVVLNLVLNARDAMPDGGRLLLRARRATAVDAAGCAAVLDPDAFVVLEVEDDGVGMDDATRRRIFEPFFSTKQSKHNAGLGLSVVYGVVQQGGGHVLVRSAPGAGTTFAVLWPIAGRDADAGEPYAPGSAARGAAAAATVLVVEDDDEVRGLVVGTLRKAGYRVNAAATAEQALRCFEVPGFRVDLVLTDVVLPGIGGLELADALERLRPGGRIAFMSGHSDELANDAPGRRFLPKPFAPHHLLDFVRGCLAGVRSG